MVKKGDTLIEVTLAVGIFSMIAVAITAVMSSGTAGAQTALETTLTREEIDTQAEALRFIQTAYATDKDSANQRFINLWKAITENAIEGINEINDPNEREAILQYIPDSCSNIFSNHYISDHAFVINPRALGTFTASTDPNEKEGIYSAFIKYDTGKLTQASIYPRLIFTNIKQDSQDALIEDYAQHDLYRAEGIYVIAIKDSDFSGTNDSGNTSIAGEFGMDKSSAYYDFHIRTCWYGTDANTPSTISTVIRLYDPDALK